MNKTAAQMTLCFVVPWITKGRGGTENVGQMMANGMAARGHRVHIITFDDQRQPSRWPLAEGIALHHVMEAPGPRQDQHMQMILASIIPDLLVGLHMNRVLTQYARLATRMDLPLVLSEHSEPRDVYDLGTNTPQEREIAFFAATRVHLVNPGLLDSVPDYLQPRCTVIPNSVPPAARRADLTAQKSVRTLLSVARLVGRKNLPVLIDTFARIAADFPDWRVQIVGEGDQAATLKARAAARGLADRVVFEGHRDDIYRFYEQADLFTLPSTSEVFGLATLEAMAHGVPVVAPHASIGGSFLVAHEQTGLLYRSGAGPNSYAAALTRLMTDADLRVRMGTATAQRYETEFHPDVVTDAWEALFAEAVSGYASRPRPSRADYVAACLEDITFGPGGLSGRYGQRGS